MKKGYRFATERINGGGAVGLVQIATRAGKRQIWKFVSTALGSRDNVLDMKRRSLQGLMHQVVLASCTSALANRRG